MDLTVRVDPAEVTLAAGQEATITVTVANAADNVEHYGVRLSGLPEGCTATATPELTKLHPGASGQIEVRLKADELRPPLAGRGYVGVTVASPYRPQVSRTAELVLEVLPAPGLLLSVAPEVVSGGDRDVALELTNTGNTGLDVTLGGRDSEGKVRLTFAPPSLRLDARATGRADLRLRARRPLSGTDVRRQVTVVATSAADEQERLVTLVQKPWVPGGVSRLVAAGTGVAVLAAAVITAAALVVKSQVAPDAAPAGASVTTSAGPSTAGSGTSSAGGSTTSGGSATTSGGTQSTGTATGGGGSTSQGGGAQPFTVDLTAPPAGVQPNQNARLTPGSYPHIALSAVPDVTRAECADVTSAAYLHLEGKAAVLPGSFTASAGKCNDLALRIDLPAAARSVAVSFFGAVTGGSAATSLTYSLREVGAGAPQLTIIGDGQPGSLTVQAADASTGLRAVVLSGEPVGNGVVPAVTSVTVTPLG